MKRIIRPDLTTLLSAHMLLVAVMTCFSLALTFSQDDARTVITVIAAAVSALLALYLICGYVRLAVRFLRGLRSRGRIVRLYIAETDTRNIVNSFLSAVYDIAFSLYCYVLTLVERSLFMFSISVLYLMIGIAKLYIVRNYDSIPGIRVKVCRLLGAFFLVIAAAVAGIRMLVFLQEGGFTRKGLMIYVTAVYTVGILVTTIISTVKSYRDKNVSWSMLLRVKHVNVLYSVFTLTVALMAAFTEDIDSMRTTSLIVGTVIAALILIYAVMMFAHAHNTNIH